MAETFKILYQGQLATSVGTLYTVPASTQTIIVNIRAVNISTTTTTTAQFFINGTAQANAITSVVSLAPGESLEFEGKYTLAATNTLRGIATNASMVTVTVSGMEIT
jgi:hypothetical protein